MNSTLQIIIVILFILFLLKNFTNFEKERKDSFFNTHKELSNLNEESCDKLLEDKGVIWESLWAALTFGVIRANGL